MASDGRCHRRRDGAIRRDPKARGASLGLIWLLAFRCTLSAEDAREEHGDAKRALCNTFHIAEAFMGKLEGRVALVTGSGRNIGRATALKLAAEGAHVVVNARANEAEAEAVAREVRAIGVKAFAVVADVARRDQAEAMVARTLSEFGRLDILINNAAIRPHKPFTELTVE